MLEGEIWFSRSRRLAWKFGRILNATILLFEQRIRINLQSAFALTLPLPPPMMPATIWNFILSNDSSRACEVLYTRARPNIKIYCGGRNKIRENFVGYEPVGRAAGRRAAKIFSKMCSFHELRTRGYWNFRQENRDCTWPLCSPLSCFQGSQRRR